ncbi:hypothetical protein [Kitasatospora sp. NPDC094011]|uniref:hypothetical protein n=1 Tax=Kitasatospora sp. NPDC094011 TaxID=3364090 RepID=UPI0037FE8487
MTVPPPPRPSYAPQQPRPGGSRANAVTVLLLAAVAVGALALPWASYSGESGSLQWSGFDILGSNHRWSEAFLDDAGTWMRALQWIGIALVVLSVLRLLGSAVRLAGLTLLVAAALGAAAAGSLVQFHHVLQGGGGFAPSMQAGPVVAAVAGVLCFLVACFGPAAQRR